MSRRSGDWRTIEFALWDFSAAFARSKFLYRSPISHSGPAHTSHSPPLNNGIPNDRFNSYSFSEEFPGSGESFLRHTARLCLHPSASAAKTRCLCTALLLRSSWSLKRYRDRANCRCSEVVREGRCGQGTFSCRRRDSTRPNQI